MPVSSVKKSPAKKPAKSAEPQGHTCDFCKKTFMQERSFLVHMCEIKRRWVAKDEQHVKLAFKVYLRFHDLNYTGRKTKTYDDFIRTSLYLAFVKFARYLI